MKFELLKRDAGARLGRLTTSRGAIETPQFMPVGTLGSVRGLTARDLEESDAQVILGNTYHLFLRPGVDLIRQFGGLHRFINWKRPILTDSGGFQVFSLSDRAQITEDGVHFKSHIDGSTRFLGPREATQIQLTFGSDIFMAFDQCPPWPCDAQTMEGVVTRTLKWAEICLEERRRLLRESMDWPTPDAALFGIVQGGSHPLWREICAKRLVELGFDGYAIGGVSVGEPEAEMMKAVESTTPFLPESQVRYAMGLGHPDQLVELVSRGVDIFDCVLPTRVARHGGVYTRDGLLHIKNGSFRDDAGPLDEGCRCYTCQNFSRAYVRHLAKADELTGIILISRHNVFFYLELMREIRAAIAEGRFDAYRREFLNRYRRSQNERGNDD